MHSIARSAGESIPGSKNLFPMRTPEIPDAGRKAWFPDIKRLVCPYDLCYNTKAEMNYSI